MSAARVVAVLVCLAATAAQVHLQRKMDAQTRVQPPEHPDVPALVPALAVGGFRRRAAADIQWVRACSYAGDSMFAAQGRPALAPLVRLVTQLDPDFQEAYVTGGLMVSADTYNAAASAEIFDRGGERFPENWRFPFLAGVTHLFVEADAARAGERWLHASRVPGAPAFLGSLADAALSRAMTCEQVLETVQRLTAGAQGAMRTSLEARERNVRLECILRSLEGAVKQYRARHGRPPPDVDALVAEGLIPGVPPHPYNARFSITAEGTVSSGVDVPRVKLRGEAAKALETP